MVLTSRRKLIAGQLQGEVLEVVLTGTSNDDEIFFHVENVTVLAAAKFLDGMQRRSGGGHGGTLN